MIQDGDIHINVDTYDILLLLDEQDEEDCMDTTSTFNMRWSNVLKSQSHNTDTPTYMEAFSVQNAEEYFKNINYEIQSLMIRDTW